MGTPLPKRPETIAAIARMKEQRMCRAKTRDGDPCKVWRSTYYSRRTGNWRCRNHGGLSTGPKTPEGLQSMIQHKRVSMLGNQNARKKLRENNTVA